MYINTLNFISYVFFAVNNAPYLSHVQLHDRQVKFHINSPFNYYKQ